MATRTFTLNTEPHEAVIGDTHLFFEPEVIGAEFMTSYNELVEMQQKVHKLTGGKANSTKHAKASNITAGDLAELTESMRGFLRGFMLPASVPDFDKLRLPDRILLELVEYVAELYGGGSGNPDAAGGTSTD